MTRKGSKKSPERGATLVEYSMTVVFIAIVVMVSTLTVTRSLYFFYEDVGLCLTGVSGGSVGTSDWGC